MPTRDKFDDLWYRSVHGFDDFDQTLEQKSRLEDAAQDRKQRWLFGWIFISLLVIQLIVVNVLMFQVGYDSLHYSDYLFHIYLLGTFGEIVGIVWLIVRYVFSERINR